MALLALWVILEEGESSQSGPIDPGLVAKAISASSDQACSDFPGFGCRIPSCAHETRGRVTVTSILRPAAAELK